MSNVPQPSPFDEIGVLRLQNVPGHLHGPLPNTLLCIRILIYTALAKAHSAHYVVWEIAIWLGVVAGFSTTICLVPG